MDVAISRLADLLATCVAVALDVDPSGISDHCDTLRKGAFAFRRAAIFDCNFSLTLKVNRDILLQPFIFYWVILTAPS